MSITTSDIYVHTVEYCETDAMRIVHHSEYVKWMEYARHHFFTIHGFDWAKMENDLGIMMPILEMDIKYKNMTRFGETVNVILNLEKFNGVNIDFSYRIVENISGQIKAIGKTRGGFINRDYHPILLQKDAPDYFGILNSASNISHK